MDNELLLHFDKLHTTQMGADRIKRNLQIDVSDVVKYCYDMITKTNSLIERKGKSRYVRVDNCKITVNAQGYTIITAHNCIK
ncbi:DUF3781 domain-containing protein [Caproicibacter sp.]|uniref:DUF3781 domain-containing protein n=1 Tax=Caproicibacter sp. TaxID=2814884 RepID=UPI00398930BC